MAGFWEGFAKELSRQAGMHSQRLLQESAQERAAERAEGRQLRMYGKQLRMKEPFDIRAHERATQAREQLMQLNVQLDQQREQQRAEFLADLEGAYNDPGFMKMREKAAKTGEYVLQAYVMMVDREMNAVMRGEKDFDIRVADGMFPIVRQRYTQAWIMNRDNEREYQRKKEETRLRILQNEAYLKNIESTMGRRKELGEMAEFKTLKDLEGQINKVQKSFTEARQELMRDFADKNVIDKKGRLKIGGLAVKNIPLLDENNEFREDAVAALLQKYPQYTFHFETLKILQAQLMKYELMKEQFQTEEGEVTGGSWTGSDGKTYEIGKTYTIGGQKVKCVGENDFVPVK